MSKFIKTNRIFSFYQKYAWLILILIAVGGFIYPKLGLILIPVMAYFMILSMFRGKYWCGNLCPHGSLFDGMLLKYSKNKKIHNFLHSRLTIAIMFMIFTFVMGTRLYKVFTTGGDFYDKLGMIFVLNYFVVTIIGTMASIFHSSRAWCKICPMGTMQGITYRLGTLLKINKKTDKKVTMTNEEKCLKCAKCYKVCPMQIKVHEQIDENNKLKNNDCIRCGVCIENCPINILEFK